MLDPKIYLNLPKFLRTSKVNVQAISCQSDIRWHQATFCGADIANPHTGSRVIDCKTRILTEEISALRHCQGSKLYLHSIYPRCKSSFEGHWPQANICGRRTSVDDGRVKQRQRDKTCNSTGGRCGDKFYRFYSTDILSWYDQIMHWECIIVSMDVGLMHPLKNLWKNCRHSLKLSIHLGYSI